MTSIIRDASHAPDIESAGAKPLLLSLEESQITDLVEAFTGVDVVYFAAGAGAKGGPERTKTVDYEGAVKVFDAIELVPQTKPRLILVSSIDVRHPDKVPDHYVCSGHSHVRICIHTAGNIVRRLMLIRRCRSACVVS